MKKILISAAIAVVALVGGFVAVTAPAHADAVTCTKIKSLAVYGSGSTGGSPRGQANLPVSAGGSLDCELRTGDSGSGVKALQTALRECHYASVSVSGTYDAATKKAVLGVAPTSSGVYTFAVARKMKWPVVGKPEVCGVIR